MNKKSFSYLTSVEVFLLSPDRKEVLLLKRAKHKTVLPGYFGGVGGKMDHPVPETPFDAACREMKEESGYGLAQVRNFRPSGCYTVEDRFGRWNVFEFTAVVRKKNFSVAKKIDEGVLTWVPVKDLGSLRLIQDLRRGLLEKLLFSGKYLWVNVVYGRNDRIRFLKFHESRR